MALTRSQLEAGANDIRVTAFFNVLGDCEGTGTRYNVNFGGGTFSSWAGHPHHYVRAGGYNSDAAGRYQFLGSTWENLRSRYGFEDFGPHNQDLGAVALLNDYGALGRLLSNDFAGAVNAAKGIWPSLPGGSQQRRNFSQVQAVYNATLGARMPASVSNLPTAITTPTFLPLDPSWGAIPAVAPTYNLFDGTPPPLPNDDSNNGGLLLVLLALFLLL